MAHYFVTLNEGIDGGKSHEWMKPSYERGPGTGGPGFPQLGTWSTAPGAPDVESGKDTAPSVKHSCPKNLLVKPLQLIARVQNIWRIERVQ